jgi:hypothetical protein
VAIGLNGAALTLPSQDARDRRLADPKEPRDLGICAFASIVCSDEPTTEIR